LPHVDGQIDACAAAVFEAQTRCWAQLDQYLSEQIVPWIPLAQEEFGWLISPRVADFAVDASIGIPTPALDNIRVEGPTPAPATASTSRGRSSYSCGSALGARIWTTLARAPATLRAKSATCVVVATTVGLPPALASPSPQPATTAISRATGIQLSHLIALEHTETHSHSHLFRATIRRMATSWTEHAHRELSRAGHRAGGAREEVLALLAGQDCCLSAQEIHDRLRGDGRAVGLASVYRALDVLAQLKLVHRIDVDGVACFEPADPSGEHHHHAICDRCGKMVAFEDPELERLIDDVGERLGYAVGGHDVVLRGACPDCAGG
jgi:Fur family ferric uptake transcriptional regulator